MYPFTSVTPSICRQAEHRPSVPLGGSLRNLSWSSVYRHQEDISSTASPDMVRCFHGPLKVKCNTLFRGANSSMTIGPSLSSLIFANSCTTPWAFSRMSPESPGYRLICSTIRANCSREVDSSIREHNLRPGGHTKNNYIRECLDTRGHQHGLLDDGSLTTGAVAVRILHDSTGVTLRRSGSSVQVHTHPRGSAPLCHKNSLFGTDT